MQTVPPPPSYQPPSPPVYTSQTNSSSPSYYRRPPPPTQQTFRSECPPQSHHQQAPPAPPQRPFNPVNSCFSSLPPPPPPPIPPPQTPPKIHHNYHPARASNLLNTVLNNSLGGNNEHRRPTTGASNNYEPHSNDSLNTSGGTNQTQNTSLFNNTVNNMNYSALAPGVETPAYLNYLQLLNSSNLYTLFDRKKQPPPPYPGPNLPIQTHQDNEMTEIHCKPNNAQKGDDKVNTFQPTSATSKSEQEVSSEGRSASSSSGSVANSSVVRTCTPQAFKFYMEQHVENVLKHHNSREYRRAQLETEMDKAKLSEEHKVLMRQVLRQKETNYLRLRRAKMKKSMFEVIKILGVGAFGEVNLVRKRDDSSRLYAMKILHKNEVFKRNQVAHVKAERDVLAKADNEWVVKLYYSFQDEENLYLVMDYVPGGDLMNLLIKFQVFDERLARFYVGELTCAIDSVHALGFIHRDIKPDNILIDRNGHIKLTDFGLCTGFHWTHNTDNYLSEESGKESRALEKKLGKTQNKRLLAHSLVGTPNYIAPEVLLRKGYTKSCDWWSVGVILYEMLVGRPPFRDETALGTQAKVINWRNTLKIPEECALSAEVVDLIFKLCTGTETRLGADGIKAHAFFRNFDFGPKLRESKAPYIPPLKHATDTSNFEPIDHSVLADRKARRELLLASTRNPNGSPLPLQPLMSKQANENSLQALSDSSASPMMYEFTFRRFFDLSDTTTTGPTRSASGVDAGPNGDKLNAGDDSTQSDGFRMMIRNLAYNEAGHPPPRDKAAISMDTSFGQETNSWRQSQSSVLSKQQLDQSSLSYQTEKLIDNTKKIQLRENTNNTLNVSKYSVPNNTGATPSNSTAAQYSSPSTNNGEKNNENLNTLSAVNKQIRNFQTVII